jgi:NADH pyrophosphatase NudC (nudix superfamily)
MNIHIPQVICMDCGTEMVLVEGTTKRICRKCELEVIIEAIEQ